MSVGDRVVWCGERGTVKDTGLWNVLMKAWHVRVELDGGVVIEVDAADLEPLVEVHS